MSEDSDDEIKPSSGRRILTNNKYKEDEDFAPVIMSRVRFPSGEASGSDDGCISVSPNKTHLHQPTIILKARDEARSLSPQPTTKKEGDSTTGSNSQQANKISILNEGNSLSWSPAEMVGSIKLLDDSLLMSDAILEYLLDQPDFLVVACVGTQGVGKSTIMSLLCFADFKDTQSYKFRCGGSEELLGEHCTDGIDVYVSSERVIYLDTGPLLSPSLLDRLGQGEKKLGVEYGGGDTTLEVHSLQILAFLMSVSHVLICIQDWLVDPNIIRLLHAAEMLKPSPPNPPPGETPLEVSPHLLILHNSVDSDTFLPKRVHELQDLYKRAFVKSKLNLYSHLYIASGSVIPSLNPVTTGEPINLYLLPDYNADEAGYAGHPSFERLVKALQCQLNAVTRRPFLHTPLSEKNWYHYASRTWECIRKSSLFVEYSRLYP